MFDVRRPLWTVRRTEPWLAAVLVLALAPALSPAGAQEVHDSTLRPEYAEVSEHQRQIVLTFTKIEAGRVVYWTQDGTCWDGLEQPGWGLDAVTTTSSTTPSEKCQQPPAEAPEDYAELSGEMVFTEPGSRSLTVTIVDDGRDEGDEYFMVRASEYDDVARQTTWHFSEIRIVDDDGPGTPGAPTSATTAAPPRGSGTPTGAGSGAGDGVGPPAAGAPRSGVAAPFVTVPPPATSPRVTSLLGELEPGPGFQLGTDATPSAANGQRRRSGSTLALLLGATATGAGGLAAWRWRRWSPTRA